MKKIFIGSVFLILSSCASILNSRTQKNIVNTTKTKSETIYINNKKLEYNKKGTISLKRENKVKQIKIVKDGYKDTYKVIQQSKKTTNYLLSKYLFHLPTLGVSSTLDRRSVKSNSYPKEVKFRSSNIKTPKREKHQKFLNLSNTEFNVKKQDYTYKTIKLKNYLKGKKKYTYEESQEDDIKFVNSIFTDSIKKVLKSFNDDTNQIFTDKANTLYISSKINKINNVAVKRKLGSKNKHTGYKTVTIYELASFFYNTSINIDWELKDSYDKIIFKKTFKVKSDDFSGDFYEENTYNMALQDAMLKSIYSFIKELNKKGLLKKEDKSKTFKEKINIKNDKKTSSIKDALNSTVTVKIGDKSHGSGCIISENGYIITNFHVVSSIENNEEIEIIHNNGQKFKAKLIRSNKSHDLALLKVNTSFINHYTLPSIKKYSMGDDIYVIGTPKEIELGQSISKGIISGIRKTNFANFIQTDASINSGNSGGALVSKKTTNLLAIVNAKFFGIGIEGIGFAIPAEIIIESLGLEITK